MTQDEMFEDIKTQMRNEDTTALYALATTLNKNNVSMLKFFKSENNLYVRCDDMPFESIITIHWLASVNNLTCRMVALSRTLEFDSQTAYLPTPYILIKSLS